MKKRTASLLIVLVLLALHASALAYESTTLHSGMRGEDVVRLQQALIDQGYLSGTADGIFGNRTENAVRKFQRKHNLKADGLAGKKTLEVLYGAASRSGASSSSSSSASSSSSSSAASSAASSSSSQAQASTGSLRYGDQGDRVRSLQQSLIQLNFLSGSADGKFGNQTRTAVIRFQRKHGLTADGIAGVKTMAALTSALTGSAASASSSASAAQAAAPLAADAGKMDSPDASQIRLLHWFDDIKPSLRTRQKLLIYDPATGLSWQLRILSRGRHLDAEPVTLEDTQIMVKAFGGKNTWNQKGVYVRLPNGTWTVGATHDMPHESQTITDNGFNGHLCVHFLRTMEECEQNDPNYGVSNQRTIRTLWKNLTGEEISI